MENIKWHRNIKNEEMLRLVEKERFLCKDVDLSSELGGGGG